MTRTPKLRYKVRRANPDEYELLGRMTVRIYEDLPGMPGAAEQPEYYSMLNDVGARAGRPTIEILVAVTPDGDLLGGVTFVGDTKYYGSGGSAGTLTGSSGIRLLAVKPEARGQGVGTALTRACIRRALDLGSGQVVLHTTKSMEKAWQLYQRLGFRRSPNLDFNQGRLSVYGFSLGIGPSDALKAEGEKQAAVRAPGLNREEK